MKKSYVDLSKSISNIDKYTIDSNYVIYNSGETELTLYYNNFRDLYSILNDFFVNTISINSIYDNIELSCKSNGETIKKYFFHNRKKIEFKSMVIIECFDSSIEYFLEEYLNNWGYFKIENKKRNIVKTLLNKN